MNTTLSFVIRAEVRDVTSEDVRAVLLSAARIYNCGDQAGAGSICGGVSYAYRVGVDAVHTEDPSDANEQARETADDKRHGETL